MNPYQLFDEAQLLFAFQVQGDVKAFEELYERYWFKLYSRAFTRTSCREDAEEIVQGVFERLWRNRHGAKIKNAGAYLAVSLQNSFYDFQRRKAQLDKFRQTYIETSSKEDTDNEVNRKLLLEKLEAALQQLPAKTQAVFRLSRFENKPVREIAHLLHLTEKAVEYHMTKALKFIRTRLKEYLPFFF